MPKMTTGPDAHQNATVASAGKPAHQSEAREVAAGEAMPTAEELDAREEHFSRPRKAMGPSDDGVPPTEPDES